MENIFCVIFVVTLPLLINGIVVEEGACPDVPAVSNFDVEKVI